MRTIRFKEVNRYAAFMNARLYQKNKTYYNEDYSKLITDSKKIYYTAYYGDGARTDGIISKAEYKEKEMRIYFDVSYTEFGGPRQYINGCVAHFERDGLDSQFALDSISIK